MSEVLRFVFCRCRVASHGLDAGMGSMVENPRDDERQRGILEQYFFRAEVYIEGRK